MTAAMSLVAFLLPLLIIALLAVGVWRYLDRAQARGRKLSTVEFSALILGAAALSYVALPLLAAVF